jgi:hypothetical protein
VDKDAKSKNKQGDNMQNVQAFYDELTPILEKVKDTPDTFLEGTGVSKVTLWRWMNGINRKYPDPHKLISLLAKISGKKDAREVITYFGGEISKFLLGSLTFLFDQRMEDKIEQNQDEIFKDSQTFFIFILCETESGASKEEILHTLANLAFKKLGINGEDITEELIKSYKSVISGKILELETNGIIYLGDDNKYHTKVKDIIFNTQTCHRFYPEILAGFRRDSDYDRLYHGLFGYQQSIPEELAREIKIETKEFFLKMYKKMRDNRTNNGVPFQIVNFSDKLSFDRTNLNLDLGVKI